MDGQELNSFAVIVVAVASEKAMQGNDDVENEVTSPAMIPVNSNQCPIKRNVYFHQNVTSLHKVHNLNIRFAT